MLSLKTYQRLPVIGAWIGILAILLIAGYSLYRSQSGGVNDMPLSLLHAKTRNLKVFIVAENNRSEQFTVTADEQLVLPKKIERLLLALLERIQKECPEELAQVKLEIRSIYIRKNGLLLLDFEKSVQYNQAISLKNEWMILRSIVQTLLENFPEIKSVKFLINGQETETWNGHIDIARSFRMEDIR